MAYTNEELAIIGRVSDSFAPQRAAIVSERDANPAKWFDYQAQLKALDAQVKAAYEKEIEQYRAGGTSAEEKDDLDQLLEDTKKLISDDSEYDDYITALPHGEQGPAQGPNTPVRRDGDMFVPKDFAPPPYRLDSFLERAQSTGGENLGQVAAEYSSGRTTQSKEKPQWLKDIESQIPPGRGFTGPYDQFGNPTGVGGTVKQASESQNTDYSIATALSGSDEQRQQQTFQAEYDPQKAQTATAAAKAYKKTTSTEDPFRSQAVFG